MEGITGSVDDLRSAKQSEFTNAPTILSEVGNPAYEDTVGQGNTGSPINIGK